MEEEKNNETLKESIQQNNNVIQNNEPVVTNEPKKGNGLVIALLIIVIVGLVGFITYDKFIKKDDSSKKGESTPTPLVTPKSTSSSENTKEPSSTPNNNSQETDKRIITDDSYNAYELSVKERITYKTKNGSDVLILVPGTDTEVKNTISKYEQYHENDVYAFYNGKLMSVTAAFKTGKYITVHLDELDNSALCSMYNLIINEETKELLDFGNSVILINDKYYILKIPCIEGESAVYTEDKELIGIKYLGHDDKYFYILNNNIVKYNANGNIVSKSNEVYEYTYDEFPSELYNGKLFVVTGNEKDIYFVDTSDFKTIKIGSDDKYHFKGMGVYDNSDGKFVVELYDKETKQDVTFIYNPDTRELTKK